MDTIKIWFDGGSVGNGYQLQGYGSYEIESESWKHRVERMDFEPPSTCNQAEYLSLIAALKWLSHHIKEPTAFRLHIWTDSKLVKEQVHGKWKCRVLHLRELRDQTLELLRSYAEFQIQWHGRENNVKRFGH